MTLSERIRAEVERCRHLYGGVEEYDTVSMDGWIDEVATLEQRVERQQKIIDLAKTYMGTKAWLKVGQAIASQEEA